MTDPATVDTAGLSIPELKDRYHHWMRERYASTTYAGMMHAQGMIDASMAALRDARERQALAAMRTAPAVVVAIDAHDGEDR